MYDLFFHLPIDLTGRNPVNHVSREPHLLMTHAGLNVRVITLGLGGFYAKHLKVFDENGLELRPHRDYMPVFRYEGVTKRTGLLTCGAIVIINPDITGTVEVTTQLVGGDLAFVLDAKERVIQYLKDNPSEPLSWGGILGVEDEFGEGPIEDGTWSRFMYMPMNEALDELAATIRNGDQGQLMQYRTLAKQLSVDMVDQIEQDRQVLYTHMDDTDDPHDLTKEQIGLWNVLNALRSTKAEAEDGDGWETYMTPLRQLQAIQVQALPTLNTHMARRDNPHELTLDQINAYDRQTIDDLFAPKLDLDDFVSEATRIMVGNSAMTVNQFIAWLTSNIDGSNLSGMLTNEQKSPTNSTPTSVLMIRNGRAEWVEPNVLVNQYTTPVPATVYAGVFATHSAAMSRITSTYVSIREYPVGSVALYKCTDTQWYRGAHQIYYSRTYNTLFAARRNLSGWTNFGGPPSFPVYIPE